MTKNRIRARLRLWAIYNELGYIPWRKPHKAVKREEGVYMGAKEAIPFMNNDGKRTFAHLLLRPGYMMRDYIMRGKHEYYLAPFTALLVFYSVFTLLLAVVQPGSVRNDFTDSILDGMNSADVLADSTAQSTKGGRIVESIFRTITEAVLVTHLDLYPEAIDAPWKASLAAIEGDIRGKGIPVFLGNFLFMWMALAILLRKYNISFSGAAAASAYVLCQFCIFMFLALLLSFGSESELGLLVMGALLFIDLRQMLKIGNRQAFMLTLKTGLFYLAAALIFYSLIGIALVLFAIQRV